MALPSRIHIVLPLKRMAPSLLRNRLVYSKPDEAFHSRIIMFCFFFTKTLANKQCM